MNPLNPLPTLVEHTLISDCYLSSQVWNHGTGDHKDIMLTFHNDEISTFQMRIEGMNQLPQLPQSAKILKGQKEFSQWKIEDPEEFNNLLIHTYDPRSNGPTNIHSITN